MYAGLPFHKRVGIDADTLKLAHIDHFHLSSYQSLNINRPNQYIFSKCTYITIPEVHFWGYSECTYCSLISRDFANKVISDKGFENFIRVCPGEWELFCCSSVSPIRFLALARALYSIISTSQVEAPFFVLPHIIAADYCNQALISGVWLIFGLNSGQDGDAGIPLSPHFPSS